MQFLMAVCSDAYIASSHTTSNMGIYMKYKNLKIRASALQCFVIP